MKLNLYSMFLCLSILMQQSMIHGINIKLLKGTHAVLTGDQTYYSPVWGLVFAEKGVSRNLYDLSQKALLQHVQDELKEVKNETQKDEVIIYTKGLGYTATETLVSQLFNRVVGDFRMAAAPGSFGTYLTPEIIGNILRLIYEDSKAAATSVAAAGEKTAGAKGLSSQVRLDQVGKLSGSVGVESLADKIKTYIHGLQIRKQDSTSFLDRKIIDPFVQAVVESLNECDIQNPKAMYAANTTQGILLGYLLKKAQTKEDLQNYFIAFSGKDISLLKEEYADSEMENLIQSVPSLSDTVNFANYLCAVVYNQEYNGELPKLANGDGVQSRFGNKSLPDCCETMVRNLCNFITYDLQNKKLGIAPQGITFSIVLNDFYTLQDQDTKKFERQDPGSVDELYIRNAWNLLVENHEGVLYNRAALLTSLNYLRCPDEYAGFMVVNQVDVSLPKKILILDNQPYEFFEKKLGNITYLLVSQSTNLVCYEIWPTVSNIIVLLNDLLQLGLQTSVADVLQIGFAEKVFPELCKKLDWEIHQAALSLIQNLEEGKVKGIRLDIVQRDSQFSINLITKAHGYVSVIKEDMLTRFPHISPQAYQQYPIQIAATVSLIGALRALQCVSSNQRTANWLQVVSYLPIQSSSLICDVIIDLLSRNQPTHMNEVKKLLMSLPADPTNTYAQSEILDFTMSYLTKINSMTDWIKALDVMVNMLEIKQNTKNVQSLFDRLFILKYLTKSSSERIELSMPQWKVLDEACNRHFDLNLNTVPKIVSLIENGLTSDNVVIQEIAVSCLRSLIENASHLTNVKIWFQIVPLIENGLNNKNNGVQTITWSLVEGLMSKSYFIEETNSKEINSKVFEWIKSGVRNRDKYIQEAALRSLVAFVCKKSLIFGLFMRGISLIKDCDVSMIEKQLSESIRQGIDEFFKDAPLNFTTLNKVLRLMAILLKYGDDKPLTVQTLLQLVEQEGVIASSDLIMPLVEIGLNENDDKVFNGAMAVIQVLIKKNLLTIEQAEQLLQLNLSRFNFAKAQTLKNDLGSYIENMKKNARPIDLSDDENNELELGGSKDH